MAYVLGIDLGTGSLKGLLMNKEGELVATASSDYPLSHPQPGYSEQEPMDWIKGCQKVIAELLLKVPDMATELEGISFSGQMHSLVLLNEQGDVLRPAILWNDVRTTSQCEKVMSEFGDILLEETKNIALEGFTLPKILWVQEKEPDIWEKVRHILLPKDVLGYWMTGNYHMDYSDAAGTLLLDLKHKTWSEKVTQQYNIPLDYLPTLIDSTGMIGTLLPDIASELGLSTKVKIFAGGADNACAALGAGIVDHSIGMVSIGTSGVFLGLEETADADYQGALHLFHHVLPNQYYSMGVTLSAGHSLSWFKETFANDVSYDDLLEPAERINIGSDGLLFTPYINGERTPHVDSQVRGSFIGMDTSHRLPHFTRAVLEGITFSLREAQEKMMLTSKRRFERLVSVGGGAKNKMWLQMQANVFNVPITCLKTEQGPGLGAAMLAALGLGWFADTQACVDTFVTYIDEIYPQEEAVDTYSQVFKSYQQVYPHTKELTRR